MKIEAYTDGACTLKDGFGGWASVIIYDKDKRKELTKGAANTTNNRMELTAVIKTLQYLEEHSQISESIVIYTDSAYIQNCFKDKWYLKWLSNGFKNSKKQEVLNKDLWEQLIPYFFKSNINFKKVKGHSNNEFNNLVDKLAVKSKEQIRLRSNHND